MTSLKKIVLALALGIATVGDCAHRHLQPFRLPILVHAAREGHTNLGDVLNKAANQYGLTAYADVAYIDSFEVFTRTLKEWPTTETWIRYTPEGLTFDYQTRPRTREEIEHEWVKPGLTTLTRLTEYGEQQKALMVITPSYVEALRFINPKRHDVLFASGMVHEAVHARDNYEGIRVSTYSLSREDVVLLAAAEMAEPLMEVRAYTEDLKFQLRTDYTFSLITARMYFHFLDKLVERKPRLKHPSYPAHLYDAVDTVLTFQATDPVMRSILSKRKEIEALPLYTHHRSE